ncbi:hypothetical protein [Subtercola sp. RTI3]|uniref:hypothetical protein n=1 Tax=Subtercola sp. RTI3 TaxID=3048639 RepID=UPI002B23C369|nr:hypothetical protein [Subtercola sp. RTI3]MEA9986793.1 hypothetical protein [Subtercola sp. RTI3]
MLAFSEFFYLVHAGQGRWVIRHRLTDELAGTVTRTGAGFALLDDEARPVGESVSIEGALGQLYATV